MNELAKRVVDAAAEAILYGAGGWNAIALEERLSCLPSAQPCLCCPSRDANGEWRMISPQLGDLEVASRKADAAVFSCPLCGALRVVPLR